MSRGSMVLGLAVIVLIALGSPACSREGDSSEASVSPNAPESVIAGEGSTFVMPLMQAWIGGYQGLHPKKLINYRPTGSGAGIDDFKKGILGFAASDAPLSDDQLKDMSPTIQVPVTAGPVCITYNLPGLARPLRLSPETLARIYLGTVASWQDAGVARDNPGVALPKAPVIVVHRVNGSGTTNIFTTYLGKISPLWAQRAGHGLTVTWPVGLSADGSSAVLSTVKQTAGTIGYLELSYAKKNGVAVASIQNRAGSFIEPTPASAAAAITAFESDLGRDVRSPIVNPPPSAKDAYPIAGFTFLLLPKDRADRSEQMAVRDFVAYAISGGQDSAEALSYSKLPVFVQQEAQRLLTQLTANGQPLK